MTTTKKKRMRIGDDSQLPLTALKGALLINDHGAEFRIHDFKVCLGDATNVLVSLREYDEDGKLEDEASSSVFLSSIESWTIQLQGGAA